MASKYTYQELALGHIRLILVSVKGAEVVYKLHNVDSDQAPPYSALSYTWDGQKPTDTIVCDHLELKVTSNVRIVLSELASITQDGDHNIWIDGVCINQKDSPEKSI